jgi:RNA polymerase sigma-70 factor (ECF subfamily)
MLGGRQREPRREDPSSRAFLRLVADAEALFVEHRTRLFRYLCRAVGHVETARDLTQDVFVRVTRAAIPVTSDGDTRAWLFSIARNLALDHHRRQRRERASPPEPVASRTPSQDASAIVHQALGALPDLERDVFLMREIGGLSYDELARVCGLTPDAVRSRLHRARLQLREYLSAPIQARRAGPMQHTDKPR